jgi:hypothetical protein
MAGRSALVRLRLLRAEPIPRPGQAHRSVGPRDRHGVRAAAAAEAAPGSGGAPPGRSARRDGRPATSTWVRSCRCRARTTGRTSRASPSPDLGCTWAWAGRCRPDGPWSWSCDPRSRGVGAARPDPVRRRPPVSRPRPEPARPGNSIPLLARRRPAHARATSTVSEGRFAMSTHGLADRVDPPARIRVVPRRAAGESSVSGKSGISGSVRPRWRSRGRFQARVSWGRTVSSWIRWFWVWATRSRASGLSSGEIPGARGHDR